MPELLNTVDRVLRRNPLIPRMEWLRRLMRQPYHRMMGLAGDGLPLTIGGAMKVRLPAAFCAKELERYEPETALAIADWIDGNRGGMFVDIGCSYGYFSCGVLFRDPSARVLGIDADLPSLAITRHVCQYAANVGQRLELFRTLIGSESDSAVTVDEVRSQTDHALRDPALKVDPKSTNYVNLDTQIDTDRLPRISLDCFLSDRLSDDVSCMIKCDVEGAEQIVFEGATQVLSKFRPTLLISVHPPYLPKFGGSVDAIRELLVRHGYAIDVIGIDHEEHWLCVAAN